jgi:hypothetical protein
MMDGYHVIVETKNSIDDQVGGEIARSLCEAYPGHPWHINVQDGLIVVKHMRLSAKWGMVRPYSDAHDAARLKREVVMIAGEFLERARLRRGAAGEDNATVVEGIPKKDLVIG